MRLESIYLDSNASTAPDPEVVEMVARALRDLYANPSSSHAAGKRAAAAVEGARHEVAGLAGCSARDVIFTSGATEADALAIRGLWEGSRLERQSRDTIVVGSTEHHAVLETAWSLHKQGARIVEAPVDSTGVVRLDALRVLMDERVLLISIMAANSESGTIAPLDAIVDTARSVGAYVHTDATQFIGRLPFNTDAMDVDLVSLSSHKMHGPKGVGALVVRRGLPLAPQLLGGGQERGLRSGTLSTADIVGFGVAARLARERFDESEGIAGLRDRLHHALCMRLPGVSLNGHPSDRLPNTLNLRFSGADADAVMASLPRVVCSTGSACSSGAPEPSHTLLAMGLDRDAADECLRFSLSRTTSRMEIDEAIGEICLAVQFVRDAGSTEVA